MSELSIEQEKIEGLSDEGWVALQKIAKEVYAERNIESDIE